MLPFKEDNISTRITLGVLNHQFLKRPCKEHFYKFRNFCPLAKEFNSVCGIWGITANVTFAHSALASPPVPEGSARYEINDEAKRYRPSISRFIAFISSFLIIIIAVCLGSFFIYHYIKTGCPPSLGSFTTVLVALGIGIVPYAANRVSAAVSTNKSEA